MAKDEEKKPNEKENLDESGNLPEEEEFTGEIVDTKFGKIKPIRIVEEMKKSYLDYAMSVIVSRALPDVRDGLKPVHRRILFAMKGLGLSYNSKYKKSARIVGEVLGKYHPHGDTAVYDAMVRLAQDFSMRYPLVDGQGNFGSVDGDSPAAMRYTEARMARITGELLEDLEKDTVNWADNFDGTFQEPKVLPAKLPNLLLMGGDGIAVGMATKIPPHNLNEVVDATIKLIDMGEATTEGEVKDEELEEIDHNVLTGQFESEATVDDLMEYIQGPDFPTGGTIYDWEEIKKIYAAGKGRAVTRAEAKIEEAGQGKYQIIVTEIPYQVNKAKLITKIAELVKKKRLDSIADLRDESDREGMRIVIELKRTAKPKATLNNLYKYTELQSSYPANMVALDAEGSPHVMTLKQILSHYVRHRQVVVVRRSQYELKQARARIHILEGFIKALENLDDVIETIKKSKDSDNAKENLIKKFEFTEIQATAILDMQLRRLSALERQKIEEEYEELKKQIDKLIALLKNPKAMLKVIVKELEGLKETYGGERRTRVVKSKLGEFNEEDFVGKEDNLITITKEGYVKRMPLSTYRSQRRGGKGVVGMTTKEEDEILHMTVGNTHDYIHFYTDRGKVYSLRVFELPEGSRQAKGQAVINLINIEQDEKVQAVITISKDQFKEKDAYVMMATRNGIVKKTPLSEYESIRASGKIGINIRKEDELINARVTDGKQYVMIVTYKGKSIKFDESEVKPTGRDTMGVKGISIKKGDHVINMETFDIKPSAPEDKRKKFFREILVVTENGLGKRTDVDEYPSQKRGGQGVKVAEVTKKTGNIAGSLLVREDVEQIVLTTKAAQVIKLPLKNIKVLGRSTQGVILMRPKKGDLVTSVTAIKSGEEED